MNRFEAWWHLPRLIAWLVVSVLKGIRGVARSLRYGAERRRRLGIQRRPPRALAGSDPAIERFLADADRLRRESLWIARDLERQLAWGTWPRYFLADYHEQVIDFLAELDEMPDESRRFLLEAGVSASRLHQLAPVHGLAPVGRAGLEALRASRIELVRELGRIFRSLRRVRRTHPYRG